MHYKLLFAGVGLLTLPAIFAQSQPGFEVAAIKPAPDLTELVRARSMAHVGVKIDGALANFGAMSLGDLIQYAFRIKSFQSSGGADTSPRFDIVAKLPPGVTPGEVPAMMQQLLVERFRLAFHWGSKQFPVYAMIVDPKGAKLTRPPEDFEPAATHALPLDRQLWPYSLDRLAELLTPYFDRPVLNETGMQGKFMVPSGRIIQAWPTRWQDRAALRNGGEAKASLPDNASVVATLAQLGLKLQSRKVPFPVLVIDKLEKNPTEQ